MKAKTSRSAATLLVAMAFAGCAAAGQAQDAGDVTNIADIVVTARRVNEKLQDVPISISVYTQEQLANRNIASSTDLAAYTPSLTLDSRYGPDKASFALRGFSQDLNTLPTVAVYFADVVAPRLTSGLSAGGNGAGPGAMFDLQNVQVLKGPQGTLFGRNTTGGAILLVPQRPTDKFEGYVEGTVGNYGTKRVEAVLNMPLSDMFKVRLGIDRYKRDGYVHNRSGIGPEDFDDINYEAARLSILGDLTPNLENYTIATYSKSHTHGVLPRMGYCNRNVIPGSPGSATLTRATDCADIDRMAAQGYGYYDADNLVDNPFIRHTQWQLIDTIAWTVSDALTVKNIASYGQARETYATSLIGDPGPYPLVVLYPSLDNPQGQQWTSSEELQFQGQAFDKRLTWQAGGYLERSAPLGLQDGYSQIFSNCASLTALYAFRCDPLTILLPTGPLPIGQIGYSQTGYSYRNSGLYEQASFSLTEKFSITAGIRNTWDWQKEVGDGVTVVPSLTAAPAFSCARTATPANAGASLLTSGACNRTFTESSNRPTWQIGTDYKPNSDMLIYAKYVRGYRGGGVNESNTGAETWQPETVGDYEAGLKTSFRGTVSGTFAIDGFWNEFKNQQTSVFIPACTIGPSQPTCTVPAPSVVHGIQNVGQSRLRGIEVDASIEFFRSLRFELGYAYLDAIVIGGSVPFCDNSHFACNQAVFLTPGTRLPFAPRNKVTVTGTYTLPVDENVGHISIGTTFTYTSSQYTDHASDVAYAEGAIPFNGSIVQSTKLLNFNLNWMNIAGKPFDLALFMTNVTGEKYYIASSGGLINNGGESFILGEPRMYGMRLKYHF